MAIKLYTLSCTMTEDPIFRLNNNHYIVSYTIFRNDLYYDEATILRWQLQDEVKEWCLENDVEFVETIAYITDAKFQFSKFKTLMEFKLKWL